MMLSQVLWMKAGVVPPSFPQGRPPDTSRAASREPGRQAGVPKVER